VPGWEKAYLFFISPFLGARGGPWIEGGYTLTVEDMKEGRRFPDILYVNFHEAFHGGSPEGYDVPYRILLPKKVDGLLVTARGAAFIKRGQDPSSMRCKPAMMILGHATGTAAALAVKNLGLITSHCGNIGGVVRTFTLNRIGSTRCNSIGALTETE